MDIIPVIDLKNGIPVHAVAGERAQYQPVQTCLAQSVAGKPVTIEGLANAFRNELSVTTVYLADLDAIEGEDPNWSRYERILQADLALWLDCGCRDIHMRDQFLNWSAQWPGKIRLILPLECLPSPESLHELTDHGRLADRMVFSLDLKNGVPLAAAPWMKMSPTEIAQAAQHAGIRNILVLDLATVGTPAGPSYLPLLRDLTSNALPEVHLAAGGGVRNVDDLTAVQAAGCRSVLIGTSIHRGAIGAREIASFRCD